MLTHITEPSVHGIVQSLPVQLQGLECITLIPTDQCCTVTVTACSCTTLEFGVRGGGGGGGGRVRGGGGGSTVLLISMLSLTVSACSAQLRVGAAAVIFDSSVGCI